MGVGGEKKAMREIDDTQGSAADDRFEMILQKVIAAGAEITKDEESPLYVEIGEQEIEIGEERIVEFNLSGMDFQIKRDVETARLTGTGRHKSIEEMARPRIDIKLKRKPEFTDQWTVVDLEEMF